MFDDVVSKLVASGEIKDWKAREILADLQGRETGSGLPSGTAAGKVILLGEHGVVYGRHALAMPIPDAVTVSLSEAPELTHDLPEEFVDLLLREMGIENTNWRIRVESRLPFGKGLGSSAAIAVAMVRAFNTQLDLGLNDDSVNAIAFESEKLAHGTPSGVDNTLSTYAEPMLFRNKDGLQIDTINNIDMPPLVIAWGEETGRTSEQVAGVRQRYDEAAAHFDALFDQMDSASRRGADLLRAGDWQGLGALMNICHGLLNAIGVSTPDLERMVAIARLSGAAGAKLTGAGGGGSIVAVCPNGIEPVEQALQQAGYEVLVPARREGE